jgi:hypothetical protein
MSAFSTIRRPCAAALLLAAFCAPAAAQGVAIVTDVSGKAYFQGGSKPAPVAILAEIAADARVQLEPGAAMVVLYARSGEEYAFSGPALLQFRGDAPVALSGAAPQKRLSPLRGNDIRLKPAATAQAAFVMRSGRTTARIRLLSLNGTKTLEAEPEFRWQALEPGVRYQFELADDTGRLLYETRTEATALKLPAAVALREGVSYTWEVSAQLSDGRRYRSAGDFALAGAELRARAAALRPPDGAPVSNRVAYAAWLDSVELGDEARRYWRALAAERPQDERLRSLAGE